MILAQKIHSEAEMEAGRIAFHKRFAELENQITVVEPISEITCENYYTLQQRGKVKICCRVCRDRPLCLTAT